MRDTGLMILLFLAGALAGGLVVNWQQANLHVWLLIGIMLTGGLLGGIVNYLLAKADEPPEAASKASLLRSVLAGVAAAMLVPLFLNMLSSKLLSPNGWEPLSALVFLGFCLVAAISSKAFITTISDRILREVREAKDISVEAKKQSEKTADAVEPILDKESEPQNVGPQPDAQAEAVAAPELSEQEAGVLAALSSQKYTLRSASGVTRDSGLEDRALVVDTLDRLMAKGLVGLQQSKKGDLWFLTTGGRLVAGKLRGESP